MQSLQSPAFAPRYMWCECCARCWMCPSCWCVRSRSVRQIDLSSLVLPRPGLLIVCRCPAICRTRPSCQPLPWRCAMFPSPIFFSLEVRIAYADAAQHAGRATAASLLPGHDDPGAVSPLVPSYHGPPSSCLLRWQPPHSAIVLAELTLLWSFPGNGGTPAPRSAFHCCGM